MARFAVRSQLAAEAPTLAPLADRRNIRMLIDLHCHTADKSDDSALTLPEIGRLARTHAIEAVCITDHEAFSNPSVLKQAGKEAGILFIPGAEINTDAGHVLVFGVSQYKFGFHHPDRLIEAVVQAGGAAILAHPYRRVLPPGIGPDSPEFEAALSRAAANPLLGMVEALEVSNGRGTGDQNEFSASLAESLDIPGTGASDAHAESDFGIAATDFEQTVSGVDDLIRELKSGRFRPVNLM